MPPALWGLIKPPMQYTLIKKEGKAVRIAICDDEPVLRAQLLKLLSANVDLPENTCIEEFPSGETLFDRYADQQFDIIFLDIQMDGKSGLEVGWEIRMLDKDAIIIFLTSYDQYVFQSLRIGVFDYIVKPVDQSKIDDVLSRALARYREQHYIVSVANRGSTLALNASEIVYIESYRGDLKFATRTGGHYFDGKLSDYAAMLSPHGFLRCHHEVLVNMSYILSIDSASIKTTTGEEIRMSVRKKQECLRAFNRFITRYLV